jgi:hypothetical protein
MRTSSALRFTGRLYELDGIVCFIKSHFIRPGSFTIESLKDFFRYPVTFKNTGNRHYGLTYKQS